MNLSRNSVVRLRDSGVTVAWRLPKAVDPGSIPGCRIKDASNYIAFLLEGMSL